MSDSNSDSSQKQVTDTQDNRIAAAPDSVALVTSRSSVGGDVNITSTDHGAVDSAFHFANQISQDAADNYAATLSAIKSTTSDALDRVSQASESVDTKIANAYTEAKAGEQKVMVAGALAIVGVIALQALKKG